MRYRLRTLLILLAIGPPLLAPLLVLGWPIASRILWPPDPLDDPFRPNVADPFAEYPPIGSPDPFGEQSIDPFSLPAKSVPKPNP